MSGTLAMHLTAFIAALFLVESARVQGQAGDVHSSFRVEKDLTKVPVSAPTYGNTRPIYPPGKREPISVLVRRQEPQQERPRSGERRARTLQQPAGAERERQAQATRQRARTWERQNREAEREDRAPDFHLHRAETRPRARPFPSCLRWVDAHPRVWGASQVTVNALRVALIARMLCGHAPGELTGAAPRRQIAAFDRHLAENAGLQRLLRQERLQPDNRRNPLGAALLEGTVAAHRSTTAEMQSAKARESSWWRFLTPQKVLRNQKDEKYQQVMGKEQELEKLHHQIQKENGNRYLEHVWQGHGWYAGQTGIPKPEAQGAKKPGETQTVSSPGTPPNSPQALAKVPGEQKASSDEERPSVPGSTLAKRAPTGPQEQQPADRPTSPEHSQASGSEHSGLDLPGSPRSSSSDEHAAHEPAPAAPRPPSTPAQIRYYCRRAWRDPAFRASVYWAGVALTAVCWRDYRGYRIESARTTIAHQGPLLDQFSGLTRELQQQVQHATTRVPPPPPQQHEQVGLPQPQRPDLARLRARLAAHHGEADHVLNAVERRQRQRWAWDRLVDRHFWPKGLWDEWDQKMDRLVKEQKELRRLHAGMDAQDAPKGKGEAEEKPAMKEKHEGNGR